MKLLHLYPNLMNLYGDYGNILVLKHHLIDQGISVTIDRKEVQDAIDFSQYDFIYMGSGTEKNLMVALEDLKKYKYHLENEINKGKVILFTGNAMELLGNSIDGNKALEIIDFNTHTSEKRFTGDLIVNNPSIGDVIGFINKSTTIEGGFDNKLFDYKFKDNNLVDNEYEGYRLKNLFGTHIIGPVLVKNPNFMNTIVKLLVKDKYQEINYEYEQKAYEISLSQLYKR